MQASDLYVRLDDPSGRHAPVVNHHRVWDRGRFMAAQRKLHEQNKNPADVRQVSAATEADYQAFRKGELK